VDNDASIPILIPKIYFLRGGYHKKCGAVVYPGTETFAASRDSSQTSQSAWSLVSFTVSRYSVVFNPSGQTGV
jgi:hypothetical protein